MVRRKRRTIPEKRRKRIIKRDGRCRYCGQIFDKYHIDHVVPIVKGGSDWSTNLVAACQKCNTSKSDRIWCPIPLPFWRLVYSVFLSIYYGDFVPSWKDFS